MGTALWQARKLARLYCDAKETGCTILHLIDGRSIRKLPRDYAVELEAQLDELNFFQTGSTTYEQVLECVSKCWVERPAHLTAARPLGFEERMFAALLDLRAEGASIRKVADQHSIHRDTLSKYFKVLRGVLTQTTEPRILRARVKSAVKAFKLQVGADFRWFSAHEELTLLGMLRAFQRVNLQLSKNMFMEFISEVLLEKCRRANEEPPRNFEGWYRGFRQRNKEHFMLSKGNFLSLPRAHAQDPATLDAWINDVHEYELHLIAAGLLPECGFQPYQILNFDEANADPQGKQTRTLVSRDCQDNNVVRGSDRTPFHATYGCMTSAAGDIIITQVIHANPKEQITAANASGFDAAEANGLRMVVSATDNGWQTSHSFLAFLEHAVDAIAEYRQRLGVPPNAPFMLFLDNHYSRTCEVAHSLALFRTCLDAHVHIAFLPAHLSHVLQPNDRAFHAHMKGVYNTTLTRTLCMERRTGLRPIYSTVTRELFNRVLTESLCEVVTSKRSKEIIASGFRKSGLLPLSGQPGFQMMDYPSWYFTPSTREAENSISCSAGAVEDTEELPEEIDDPGSDSESSEDLPPVVGTPPSQPIARTPSARHTEQHAFLEYQSKYQELCAEFGERLHHLQLEFSQSLHNIRGDVDALLSPACVLGAVEARCKIPTYHRTASRRSNCSIMGTADMRTVIARMEQAARQKADDERGKREKTLARHRKQMIFALYCADHGVTLTDEVPDDVLMPLSEQFSAAMKDKDAKEQLKARAASEPPRGKRARGQPRNSSAADLLTDLTQEAEVCLDSASTQELPAEPINPSTKRARKQRTYADYVCSTYCPCVLHFASVSADILAYFLP